MKQVLLSFVLISFAHLTSAEGLETPKQLPFEPELLKRVQAIAPYIDLSHYGYISRAKNSNLSEQQEFLNFAHLILYPEKMRKTDPKAYSLISSFLRRAGVPERKLESHRIRFVKEVLSPRVLPYLKSEFTHSEAREANAFVADPSNQALLEKVIDLVDTKMSDKVFMLLNDDEIKRLTAFYSSTVGVKILKMYESRSQYEEKIKKYTQFSFITVKKWLNQQ